MEVCSHNFGVIWKLWDIFLLVSQRLAFHQVEFWPFQPTLLEFSLKLFLCFLFILLAVICVLDLVKHVVVVKIEFVGKMAVLTFKYLHTFIFKRNEIKTSALELKHQDVVDQVRDSWNHCLAGHSVLFCDLDGLQRLLGDKFCVLLVE